MVFREQIGAGSWELVLNALLRWAFGRIEIDFWFGFTVLVG